MVLAQLVMFLYAIYRLIHILSIVVMISYIHARGYFKANNSCPIIRNFMIKHVLEDALSPSVMINRNRKLRVMI